MSLTEGKLNRLLNELSFDANGLIPAIAQQFDSGEVMMAWMNKEAIKLLTENRGVYWSRSEIAFGVKASAGQIQQLKEFRWDCDRDQFSLSRSDRCGVSHGPTQLLLFCHTGG